MALGKENPADALSALPSGSRTEWGEFLFVDNMSCLYTIYVRGEAYLADGQGGPAAAEFQKILDHSGIVLNCWTGALAHLGVARSSALQAKTSQGADADAARERALAAYKDFLTLWKGADPAIPILKEAKAEYEKLQQLENHINRPPTRAATTRTPRPRNPTPRRHREAAADRRHLKDVAVLLRPHHWHRGPCRVHDTVEARIHDSLEIFRAHLLGRLKLPITGIVDQNVQPPEAVGRSTVAS
jgi:hypothetical protein